MRAPYITTGPWTAITTKWPELRVTDPLPVPMALRIVSGILVAIIAGVDALRFLESIEPNPHDITTAGLEIFALIGASYLPLIGTLIGPRLGILALALSYTAAFLAGTVFVMFIPGVMCTLIVCMWLRWEAGAALFVAQVFLAITFGVFIKDPTTWPGVFALVLLVSMSAALGMTIRFFRCKTLLSARKIAQMEYEAGKVRAAERQDLARELHDLVAHDVTATALRANAGLLSQDQNFQRTALKDIADSASETIANLRRLVNILREEPVGVSATRTSAQSTEHSSATPERLTPPTLTMSDVLQHSIQLLHDSGYRNIKVQESTDWEHVTTSVRSACQRVVQESCANIVRHGDPRGTVSIRTEIITHNGTPGWAEVEVVNQLGQPPQPSSLTPKAVLSTGGFGLLGLRERVSVFGGELSSGPHGGHWVVSARIPLQEIDLR